MLKNVKLTVKYINDFDKDLKLKIKNNNYKLIIIIFFNTKITIYL